MARLRLMWAKISDKRRGWQDKACVFVFIFAASWFSLTAAIADTLPDKPLTQGDLVRAQWWLIGGLLGFVLIIGQGFIIYVVSGVKSNVRDIFHRLDKVVTKDDHADIDHSQLCAVCRNAELKARR